MCSMELWKLVWPLVLMVWRIWPHLCVDGCLEVRYRDWSSDIHSRAANTTRAHASRNDITHLVRAFPKLERLSVLLNSVTVWRIDKFAARCGQGRKDTAYER